MQEVQVGFDVMKAMSSLWTWPSLLFAHLYGHAYRMFLYTHIQTIPCEAARSLVAECLDKDYCSLLYFTQLNR